VHVIFIQINIVGSDPEPLLFLPLDPGSGSWMEKIRIRDGKNSDPG
jgi:hypothetical protein